MKTKYVVYHAASTMEVKTYKSAYAAAKMAEKMNAKAGAMAYFFATEAYYKKVVVKTVERTNIMSGKTYFEASNTPGYMSPSSEAYWSM